MDFLPKLKDFFAKQENIAFTYLFGSTATGNTTAESDVDIAVYFSNQELEYEAETEYPTEDTLWTEIERLVSRRIDLVVLNRAPATLAISIINRGRPIYIRDQKIHDQFYSTVWAVATDFREVIKDFVAIRGRSHSLTEIDRDRLVRLKEFLIQELADVKTFQKIDQLTYQSKAPPRRELERWAENIVNASIDIAKIMLASEKKILPETYRLLLEGLATIKDFDPKMATQLAEFTRIRNILAHQYLDMRFSQLKKFIDQSGSVYGNLIAFVEKFTAI